MRKNLFALFIALSSISISTTLYNGITLPNNFPEHREAVENVKKGMNPYYLNEKINMVNIDKGRQLFVDDFLISKTDLERNFHYADKMKNPVLKPDKPWEMIGTEGSGFAAPFSDGVWYDEKDNKYKMWYYAGGGDYNKDGNSGVTCYAESADGINWIKPELDVVKGTNIVDFNSFRDSSTVWLDKQEKDPTKRFKMFIIERINKKWYYIYKVSSDGIHWTKLAQSERLSDRSTVFKNPFRNVWAFSIRHNVRNKVNRELTRARDYMENVDPLLGVKEATADLKYFWTGPWNNEIRHPKFPATVPGIYNIDATPYESIMLGLFTVWAGPENLAANALKVHKQNQIMLGYSRDGYEYYREDMKPFIAVSKEKGSFDTGNIQSVAGSPLIVGDKLYFYYSGRTYNSNEQKETATGLATLRRDGFVSMSGTGTLETKNFIVHNTYLFVNANINKDLKVELLDENGKVIKGFEKENSIPFTGDSTKVMMTWKNNKNLKNLKNKIIRIKFYLNEGDLYSFWLSPNTTGVSDGYTAGGGPKLNLFGIDK